MQEKLEKENTQQWALFCGLVHFSSCLTELHFCNCILYSAMSFRKSLLIDHFLTKRKETIQEGEKNVPHSET